MNLAGEFEPWAPPQPFDANTYGFASRSFTKPELLGYVDWCRRKGAKDRRVRFGPKTAPALSRYLRARDKHSERPADWWVLGVTGAASSM
jgi:hypothetical protein